MSKYTGILEASNMIVELLREELVPDIIKSPDTIGLCSPDDRGDFQLGIHLYDIREDDEFRSNEMVNVSVSRQKYPPVNLALFYIITAYSNADVKFREGEEHRILGRVVQILNDHAVMRKSSPGSDDVESRIRINQIAAEEKMRLWNYQNIPYKTSLYYKVAPVQIESAKIKSVQRVMEAEFSAVERQED